MATEADYERIGNYARMYNKDQDIDRHTCSRVVPMQVICPGYSRTGTLTMHKALSILGYPTYHFSSIYDNVRDSDMWLELINAKYQGKGTYSKDDFDKLLGHSSAVVDMPVICFAPELIAYYPEAQVVLVERDVNAWLKSWYAFLDNAMSPVLPLMAKLEPYYLGRIVSIGLAGNDVLFNGARSKAAAKARSKEAYLKHYALVRSVTPKERLLEFSLADGWEPLCKFLGKPVPDVPFPHENDTVRNTKSFEELATMAMNRIAKRAAYAFAILGIPGIAFYMTRRMR